MKIAEVFSKFSTELTYEEIPRSVVETVKLLFLDWLGSTFSGSGEASTGYVLSVANELQGKEESTVIVDMSRNSCIMAALVNGVSSHVLEMDDVHRPGIYHPGGPVFSAILPVAEKLGSPGKKIIEAAVVGYEIGIRSAIGVGGSHYNYWHTTGTCGTFGAAAAVAKLLSLDCDQTTWALGTAGTQTSGLWAFLADNAMSKQLHPAKAAVNGILAGYLAQKGFTGPSSIYEGEKGFFRATSADFSADKAIESIGEGEFKVTEVSIKKHASCGHTHSCIDAVIDITSENKINYEQIISVEVEIYKQAIDLLKDVKPDSTFLAKMSIEFCVATAAIYGKVGLEAFTEERITDNRIKKYMKKVSVVESEILTNQFPEKYGSIVKIKTKNNKYFTSMVIDPKGTPNNRMSKKEVYNKYHDISLNVEERKRDLYLEKIEKIEFIDDINIFFKSDFS